MLLRKYWHWFWPNDNRINNQMYSIEISGYIPQAKSKEFKQHVRLLASQLNDGTTEMSVLQNMINEDLFEVKVTLKDKESMILFMKSDQYASISGSFRTLGMLRERNVNEYSKIKPKDEPE